DAQRLPALPEQEPADGPALLLVQPVGDGQGHDALGPVGPGEARPVGLLPHPAVAADEPPPQLRQHARPPAARTSVADVPYSDDRPGGARALTSPAGLIIAEAAVASKPERFTSPPAGRRTAALDSVQQRRPPFHTPGVPPHATPLVRPAAPSARAGRSRR